MKAEADRQLFIVPRRVVGIASEIEQLGRSSRQPALEALGAMTAADGLRAQGRYADALREYDRAGQRYLAVGDDVGWARTRLGAAYARVVTVELGPALEEAEQARGILAGRGLWVRLARLESAIGNLLSELGRTHEALTAHERAAATARRIKDGEERELVGAEVRINQALAFQRLDKYDHAEQLLETAADTFRKYERPVPVAIARSNLARGLAARGHVSRALALANDVRQVMLALGRVTYAAIAGQVAAECLLELNRPGDAANLADEIVAQLTTSGAGAELAKTLLQRAVAYERLDRDRDAADDLAQAEALFRMAGSQGWAAVVRVHHAEVLERTGALLESVAEASAASIELRRRHQLIAAARADLVRAAALRRLGDVTTARAAARTAGRVAHMAGVPLLEYRAWRVLGEIAVDGDDRAHALHAFSKATGALEQTQGRILTEQRAGFLSLQDKLAVYESAIRLSLDAGDARKAFGFAERSKARALLDALALRAAGVQIRASTPAARALAVELANLRRKYDRLSSTLYQPTPQDDLGSSAVAGDGAVVRRELQVCEERMAQVLEELRSADATSVQELEALQGKIHSPLPHLGTKSALVQYAIVGSDVVIFVLRRGRPIQARVAPSGATEQVVRLRRLFELNVHTVTNGRREPALEQQARALLQRLYGLLIGPVEDLLNGSDRLVIVPHGVLHGIPFAALHDGTGYLTERYELALAPSASALSFWRRKRDRRAARHALVVAHSADGLLPGALAEGRIVADFFGAQRLFETRATVQRVREQLAHASVVHVAAHGHSRADAPLFSHIRLADGQLTALDCLELSVECDLVTLSACETGHGVVAAGDEPIGLTRSLLYAGARSVIQSLWRVDDEATSRLMAEVYRRLCAGAGRAEALREAQRTFITMRGASTHPAFWAAFALVGDWTPLK